MKFETRREANEYIRGQLESYLRQRGIDTTKPFRCLNPAHTDEHPSMSFYRDERGVQRVHCFACGAHYDIFDVISIDYGILTERLAFEKADKLFGVEAPAWGVMDWDDVIDDGDNYSTKTVYAAAKNAKAKNEGGGGMLSGNGGKEETITYDFTAIIEEAHRQLLEAGKPMTYLTGRGLSEETVKAYKIGYTPEGHNALLKDFPALLCKSRKANLYRLVLPYLNASGGCSYFVTEIADRNAADNYNGKYRKLNGLKAEIFNERYLIANTPEVIFVCEGIYDALSVEEVGGKALAFVGVGTRRFISLCKEYKPNTVFVISLDNDETGRKASQALQAELGALGIPFIVRTAEAGKDFNEALQADREAFKSFVEQTSAEARETALKAKETALKAKENELEAYKSQAAAHSLQGFLDRIKASKSAVAASTGFPDLDGLLDGGLYSGLYVIGAITSLGKTTFSLQVMDTIARAGRDVMIFSLEMAADELIAKSISRGTMAQALKLFGSTGHAKTTRGILTGSRYDQYSGADMQVIQAAMEDYAEFSEHVYILEGMGNIGAAEVRAAVEKHIDMTGEKPVVMIDYLQILAPAGDRLTDKQAIDKNVLELKRISRDFDLPVLAVSSFNRDSYYDPVKLSAFKESGAVEYTSDALIGLQYAGMEYKSGESKEQHGRRVRQLLRDQEEAGRRGKAQLIELKVLKNRNGTRGSYLLDFFPMFNHFAQSGQSGVANDDIDEFEEESDE